MTGYMTMSAGPACDWIESALRNGIDVGADELRDALVELGYFVALAILNDREIWTHTGVDWPAIRVSLRAREIPVSVLEAFWTAFTCAPPYRRSA